MIAAAGALLVGRALAGAALAATPTPNNQPGGQGQEFGSSGPVALIVILVLLIATVFLIRSMSKHLKRVPASFDPDEIAAQEAATPPAEPETEAGQEKQDH